MPSSSPNVSLSVIRRLSSYLRALEALMSGGSTTVSSQALAELAGTTAAQVRKDLSRFGSFGKRGLGYSVGPLHGRLRDILGLNRRWRVALVGAGRIGAALFAYPQLKARGFEVVTIFDSDPEKIGTEWNGVVVQSAATLEESLRANRVEIVILAIPADSAQDASDAAVLGGVRGILNFAPARIQVPEGIVVHEVNLVVELEALSFALGSGIDDSSLGL